MFAEILRRAFRIASHTPAAIAPAMAQAFVALRARSDGFALRVACGPTGRTAYDFLLHQLTPRLDRIFATAEGHKPSRTSEHIENLAAAGGSGFGSR